MQAKRTRAGRLACAVTAAALAAGACSGNGDHGASDTAAEPTATTAAPASPTTSPATTAAATTAPPAPERIEVSVGVGPTTTVLAHELTDAAQPGDPFGPFAACSGLEGSVGVWSLQLSDPAGDMTAVSIVTLPPITGPGVYDASFRLEWVNGAALDASGVVELDPGLQSGTFAATDSDLRGSFSCEGPVAPTTLDAAAVEVYALLQRGPQERVVSVAAPLDGVAAQCPAAGAGPVTIGGAAAGTITAFTVGDAATPLAIRVGATDLPVVPSAVTTDTGPGAGTFHATTLDGVTIDGAYRCT